MSLDPGLWPTAGLDEKEEGAAEATGAAGRSEWAVLKGWGQRSRSAPCSTGDPPRALVLSSTVTRAAGWAWTLRSLAAS